jgi:hypothetical protein
MHLEKIRIHNRWKVSSSLKKNNKNKMEDRLEIQIENLLFYIKNKIINI